MNPSYKLEKVTPEKLDEIGLFCSRSKPKAEGY
jgi:hypothetical protein